MTNRLLEKVTVFISLIFLLISGTVSSQSVTSIFIPPATVCPDSILYPPINVTQIQEIDSIYLSIRFNPENVQYVTFRQVNPLLNQNGTASVTLSGDRVVFVWGARPGLSVSIADGKLFELGFRAIQLGDSIYFDESVSIFRNDTGTFIPMTYQGTRINMYPRMSIQIEEIDATCPGECEANIAAFVSGGARPYLIKWMGVTTPLDSVFTGACKGSLPIEVTDANNCKLDTTFQVSALDSTLVTLETDPDTIYMQNPVVFFSFEHDNNVVDWYWNFGDNSQETREETPIHLYSGASNTDIENYTARLVTTSENGCTQITTVTLPVSELPIFIPNVFTPNGDQSNNYFKIAKKKSDSEFVPIDSEYINMELVVFDRWGRKVYENLNYRNNWDGDNLPEGTYFYRLNTFGYYKNESFKGSVTILR